MSRCAEPQALSPKPCECRRAPNSPADLLVDPLENPTPSQMRAIENLKSAGVRATQVTLATIAAGSDQVPDPVPSVIKSVDPTVYPMYGKVRLDPPQPLAEALAGNQAVVSADLLKALDAHVGGELRINGAVCRISGRIEWEPDRFFNENFSSGMRVIVSRDALDALGVLRTGAPAVQLVLVNAPLGTSIRATQARLERIFPDGLVLGLAELNPQGQQAIEITARSIAMIAWMALAIGAAGMALATRYHIESRIDIIVTLKSLGARPGHTELWFGLELLIIAAAGALAGCLAGFAAQWGLLRAAQLPVHFSASHAAILGIEAIGGAVLLSESIGLSWMLAARRLRPRQLERRHDPRRPIFAPALRYLGPAGRHGIRSLLGAGSGTLLSLVAFVSALLTAAATGQGIVMRSILRSLPVADADLYLTGFPDSQLEGVRRILDTHAGIRRPYDFMNLAWLRVAAVPIRSWGARATIADGELFGRHAGSGAIVDTSLARRLGVRNGSELYFESDGISHRIAVADVRDVPPVQRNWYSITIPCSAIDSRTLLHGALLRVPEAEISALTRELRANYPFLGIVTRRISSLSSTACSRCACHWCDSWLSPRWAEDSF